MDFQPNRGDQPAASQDGLGLRDITARLTTPALSGMVLSRDQLGRIAAQLELPIGLTERSLMLANMLRGAAELGRLPQLITAMQQEAQRWLELYEDWANRYPASESVWLDWRERALGSLALLHEMAATLTSAAEADLDRGSPRG